MHITSNLDFFILVTKGDRLHGTQLMAVELVLLNYEGNLPLTYSA